MAGGGGCQLCGWKKGGETGVFTRWFVRMALPSLHLTEKGSLPGKEFGVWSVSAVRGGEVKRTFSRERGTKEWGPSSMTQLVLLARAGYQEYCCIVLTLWTCWLRGGEIGG